MKYLFVSFILLFVIENSYSQSVKVRNVHYRQIDEQIEIFYDLPITHDSLNVKVVFRKKSAPKFKYNPRFIEGDVSIGIFSGKNKKIVWDISKEPTSVFTGSGFYFDVKVRKWTEKRKER